MCMRYMHVLVMCLGAANAALNGGYFYPSPPPLYDDIVTPPSPVYLPPPEDVPQIIPTYLPPNEDHPPDDSVVIPSNPYLPPHYSKNSFQILNMSCLDSGFFRAHFRAGRHYPVMDHAGTDCLVSPFGADGFRIDLEGSKMSECGMRNCGVKMCLTLRMASVPGLRLAEDFFVNLQCLPQEAVVSQTKHLRLRAQAEQSRSSSKSISVASGGSQRKFDSVITLLRKNNGVYDQPIHQGGAVRLGDELLLRTSVKDGDGWQQSRIGSVIIKSGTSQRSVVLVDENGCRNPSMRPVCPQQPQHVAPLTIHLPFRAFLFQGASPADDLLLSVRMSACLRPRDCYQNCEDHSKRAVRSIGNETKNFVKDWETELQFRVLPKETLDEPRGNTGLVIGLAVAAAVLGCLVVGMMLRPIKERIYL